MLPKVTVASGYKGFPREAFGNNDYNNDITETADQVYDFVSTVSKEKSNFICNGEMQNFGWVSETLNGNWDIKINKDCSVYEEPKPEPEKKEEAPKEEGAGALNLMVASILTSSMLTLSMF